LILNKVLRRSHRAIRRLQRYLRVIRKNRFTKHQLRGLYRQSKRIKFHQKMAKKLFEKKFNTNTLNVVRVYASRQSTFSAVASRVLSLLIAKSFRFIYHYRREVWLASSLLKFLSVFKKRCLLALENFVRHAV